MTGSGKKHGGFATVMALVALMLVGVTVAGLMTRISMQAKRTQADANRAQREQIAIARSLGTSGDAVMVPVGVEFK